MFWVGLSLFHVYDLKCKMSYNIYLFQSLIRTEAIFSIMLYNNKQPHKILIGKKTQGSLIRIELKCNIFIDQN